jgi:hypothetical protein
LVAFEKDNALFILIRGNFNDVAHWAESGIAMAGTATEQLVRLLNSFLQYTPYHSCLYGLRHYLGSCALTLGLIQFKNKLPF